MTNKKFRETEYQEIKKTLIAQARARWPNHILEPCGTKETLDDCFTVDILKEGYLVIFWYNIGGNTCIAKYKFHNEKAHYYLKFDSEDKNGKI